MKILHFADSHVGVELYGRPDPASGLNTRLIDFGRALDQIADAAINEKVDLVVFAGDAYRSREPNPTHQREFARRILRISRVRHTGVYACREPRHVDRGRPGDKRRHI